MTLPEHGRISCSLCHAGAEIQFDRTVRTEGAWRLTANPLAWGSAEPEIIVLGFSKGPTQAGAIEASPHDEIPYKGGRGNVAKILAHLGLLDAPSPDLISREIARTDGRLHFGSLVRCTVERFDESQGQWVGTGGGMLEKFVASPFGREVAGNCTRRFLGSLPATVKLVILFGMGTKLSYVHEAFALIRAARGGEWRWINDISYTDDKIVVVHVEHFKSLGTLVPDWLGQEGQARGRYGRMARDAVMLSGAVSDVGQLTTTVPKMTATIPARKRRMAAKAPKTIPGDDKGIAEITDTFLKCSYKLINETKKIVCFAAPSGREIYVLKEQLRPGQMILAADPTIEAASLRALAGNPEVEEEYRYNSNFRGFPKMENTGRNPEHYGRKLMLTNSIALADFLQDYSSL